MIMLGVMGFLSDRIILWEFRKFFSAGITRLVFMPSSEIVVCENLYRSFYSKEFGTKNVLRDINFRMSSEDFIVIIGPSGCGKSTFSTSLPDSTHQQKDG